MTIFLCRDEFESILCGVYDAWASGLGHDSVRLETKEGQSVKTLWLFAEYREAKEEAWKARAVAEAVRKKISSEAYAWIYRAALSGCADKADQIYRFLVRGFLEGRRITGLIQEQEVYRIYSLNRRVENEAHLLTGFLRFSQMRPGLLAAVIGPENDVTGFLADHFSDRMPGERWIIYDEKRDKAALHEPGRNFLLLSGLPKRWRERLSLETDEKLYEELWRTFHQSVSIRERENRECQRTHMPLRFRPYMTEFGGGEDF